MALRRRELYRSRTVIEQEMRVTGSDGVTLVPFYMVEGPIARRIMHRMEYDTTRSQEMMANADEPYATPHRVSFYRNQALDYMLKIVSDFYLLTGEIIEHDWDSIAVYWD